MSCIKTQYSRKIICASAMNDWIEILSRTIKGTNPNNSQSVAVMTPIIDYAGILEAVRDTPRIEGVNPSDSSTHAVYIPFDQSIFELDRNKFFIRITREEPRLFKFLGVKNWGEQDEYLQIKLVETGFEKKEAASG